MSLFWSDFRHASSVGSFAADSLADANANAAQVASREARDSARDYDERLDQLLLVCAAMWELLRERAGVTEEDLVNRIAEIDARDGVADGKMTHTPQKCPKCARTIFPRHQKCLYCGADVPLDSVFKTI